MVLRFAAALVLATSSIAGRVPAPAVTITVHKAGDGKVIPRSGQIVRFHYTGTLAANGHEFDSSRTGDGEPFRFRMGTGAVIPCYEQALVRMSVGERATIHCPASLAYGEAGVPGTIPPNADLDFDVELLSAADKPLSLFEQLKQRAMKKLQASEVQH
eukprot:gnl/TRDRNA2_/TRDRNA2_181363_c0_seq1.p1 gnl/TRDRNA2_/TRDRNA2_181363_c0~~gnl/TRDRNA2_/TRDRNA2_181363_c0_seq1.p1  ORF type:complete len:158 (-),score=33.90 gnl/TRDRNA2_/TRDRNA2_181363_c0_seq1:94-567(-)